MQKYRRNKKKKGDDVRLEIENIPIMKYGKIQTEIINILKKNGIENIDILQQKEGEKNYRLYDHTGRGVREKC